MNNFKSGEEFTVKINGLGEVKVVIEEILGDVIFYEGKHNNIENSCHYEMFEEMLIR